MRKIFIIIFALFYVLISAGCNNEPDVSGKQEQDDTEINAKAGNPSAQYEMGERYRFASPDVARHWYEAAAKQGDIYAMARLAEMYEDGKGGYKDIQEAARLYLAAAKQGHVHAAFKIGEFYTLGTGIPQNIEEAHRWLKLAAENGHRFAFGFLGNSYAGGIGVKQDLVLGYVWLNLAVAADTTGRDLFVDMRDNTAARLSPKQLTEAQKRAALCLESNYSKC